MITMYMSEELDKLEKNNNEYIVGVLAGENDDLPNFGETETPVTFEKNSDGIRFYIRPLSEEPDIVSELNDMYKEQYLSTLYHGYTADIWSFISDMDYRYSKINEKKDMIEDLLKDKVILFKPRISRTGDKAFKNIQDVTLESGIELNDETSFTGIPVLNMDVSEFENKLLNGEDLVFKDYSRRITLPNHILCKDKVDGYYLYGNLGQWEIGEEENTLKHKYLNQVSRINIDMTSKQFKGKVINATDNLIFIEDKVLVNIEDKLGENRLNISTNDGENIKKEEKSSTSPQEELHFIKYFSNTLKDEGLCYSEEDIINFHTSIKTNFLTILSGMSGTGKTQLAISYGKSLGLSMGEENLLIIPIKPSYTEPEDVLGFLNISNGLYTSSDTGLVELLKRAQDNPKEMHVVVFDEMNLSQVEYWFAPFISLLEVKEDRKISLYSEKSSVCHNLEKYPPYIEIGDNIRFIGTVNIDETVKDFSDRLLDRANVVTLTKQSFLKYKKEQEESNIDKDYIKTYDNKIVKSIYRDWISNEESIYAYNDEEIMFFDELHNLISSYDNSKGVSFRTLERIGDYLNNIPHGEFNKNISKEEAMDIQVKQRILTKVNGSREQFMDLIGYMDDNDKLINSKLYDFFDSEGEEISGFIKTKEEIKRKARELSLYGYTN